MFVFFFYFSVIIIVVSSPLLSLLLSSPLRSNHLACPRSTLSEKAATQHGGGESDLRPWPLHHCLLLFDVGDALVSSCRDACCPHFSISSFIEYYLKTPFYVFQLAVGVSPIRMPP